MEAQNKIEEKILEKYRRAFRKKGSDGNYYVVFNDSFKVEEFLLKSIREAVEEREKEIEKWNKKNTWKDLHQEKKKMNNKTTKKEAVDYMNKIIKLAKPCPFCGNTPIFAYRVDEKHSKTRSVGHYVIRESCCKTVGRSVDLFFCNNNEPADYGLWASLMFWEMVRWNDRELKIIKSNDN